MQQYFGIKKEDKTLFLDSYEVNHIKNVMRNKSGDKVFIVFDNIRYLCEFNNDLLSANIIEKVAGKEEKRVVAYIPVLQEAKMSFVFEKGTEMGVTHFVPVGFERCKYKLDNKTEEKKLIRWQRICKEAAEQSRRFIIPKVSNAVKVDEIIASENVNVLLSLDKENVKHVSKVLNSDNIHDTISLLFGPEGGITSKEEEILDNVGFIKTSLGDTVLRSETVIISIMSIINYLRS